MKTWSYLILGGSDPIVVDTGASSPEIMSTLGMTGIQTEEMMLEVQLGKHGVEMDDVRWILHTHHHIDHAGQDDRFPKATVDHEPPRARVLGVRNHGRPVPR